VKYASNSLLLSECDAHDAIRLSFFIADTALLLEPGPDCLKSVDEFFHTSESRCGTCASVTISSKK
jgi:hypothetical protein